MTLKIFEMFAGYGGASFSLKKAGIDFECVGYSEIDKYAIECYDQNHCWKPSKKSVPWCESPKNYGDCTKINPYELPDFDLLTGGFPCQSFSVAGKGLGELDTRGTLFNEIIRIAEIKKPRYMLLENVKGLTNKKHQPTFNKILSEIKRIGYEVQWKVLNSKEHGIPQNRERVFFICFRNFYDDVDFKFPEKEELKIFLKDILENEVDEKYYLKKEQVDRLIEKTNVNTLINEPSAFDVYNKKIKNDGLSLTLTEPHHNSLRLIEPLKIGNVNPSGKGMNGNVHGGNIAPTVTTNKGEGSKIIQIGNIKKESERRVNDCPLEINLYLKENKGDLTIKEIAEKTGESLAKVEHYFRKDKSRAIPKPDVWFKLKEVLGFDDAYDKTVSELEKFYVEYESSQRVYSEEGCSPCLSVANSDKLIQKDFTIRKLTPKECFRLMGFNDEINLEGISNSQQYKLAGNGWDINLVSKIFKKMLSSHLSGSKN